MRKLSDHKLPGLNEALEITVLDAVGADGANHLYEIAFVKGNMGGTSRTIISFQNGPIKEVGVNGISTEALLAIVMDRLEAAQAESFSRDDNATARKHAELALFWMQKRTKDRLATSAA